MPAANSIPAEDRAQGRFTAGAVSQKRAAAETKEPLNKSGPKRSAIGICPFEAQIARNSQLLRRFVMRKGRIPARRSRIMTCSEVPGACSHYKHTSDGGHFFAGQGAVSALYSLYMSEMQRRPAGKWPRPLGLLPQNGPCCVARRSFSVTKRLSSRLAWPVLGQQRLRVCSVNRP